MTPRPLGCSLAAHRQTWAFALGKFMTDPIWWFYLFWIPKFLNEKHGLTLEQAGSAAHHDLPRRRRGQHRRRLALLAPDQARLDRQRRAQDGHARLRAVRRADHLRLAGDAASGPRWPHQPRRGRAPGLERQPLHPRLRHVPAAGRGLGGRHRAAWRARSAACSSPPPPATSCSSRAATCAIFVISRVRLPGRARGHPRSWPRGSSRPTSERRPSSMKPFIHDDFLLETDLARELYHRDGRGTCRSSTTTATSPVEQIATDHRFRSITEIWLEGDHYKWRAMRANGVAERFCTGDASDWEKFEAWARTVPDTLRNPLYHWTHMELRRPFGITRAARRRHRPRDLRPLQRAPAGARLHHPGPAARSSRSRSSARPTTPRTRSTHHARPRRARRSRTPASIRPGARTAALAVDDPAAWNAWVAALEAAADTAVAQLGRFLRTRSRSAHAVFHDAGLPRLRPRPRADLRRAMVRRRRRPSPSTGCAGGALRRARGDALRYKSALLHRLAVLDHARGWVQQFHLGALRNNNTRLRRASAPTPASTRSATSRWRGRWRASSTASTSTNQLAKTILYNLNPRDNELFATMVGNFQDGSVPGKMQYGSAWWFLDQKDGMEAPDRARSRTWACSRASSA